MQIGGVEENLKIIFETATLIFGSIIKGYNNDKVDFLSRLTT